MCVQAEAEEELSHAEAEDHPHQLKAELSKKQKLDEEALMIARDVRVLRQRRRHGPRPPRAYALHMHKHEVADDMHTPGTASSCTETGQRMHTVHALHAHCMCTACTRHACAPHAHCRRHV